MWIEISGSYDMTKLLVVTPRAGVWIEIQCMVMLFIGQCQSLPVRECGLKLPNLWDSPHIVESLPVRECGLKSEARKDAAPVEMSLPVRECGLKFL